MNAKRLLSTVTVLLLGAPALALAEASARQDNSTYLTWAFLGMCALIVIVQLMPVLALAFGLVKGLLSGKHQQDVKQVAAHK